jgi:hypothetical protein
MIDPTNVPEVTSDEYLARFVLFSGHVRAGQTVKPNAFMPHPYLELSVTRHLSANETELWAVGSEVARVRSCTLHGRADFAASACMERQLAISAAPLLGNPNHANITGWPSDKPAQKTIAQLIAASSIFLPAHFE